MNYRIASRDMAEDKQYIQRFDKYPTLVYTIAPTKSELYGGQQQTFVVPYTCCDRIADYRRACSHLSKIFNK